MIAADQMEIGDPEPEDAIGVEDRSDVHSAPICACDIVG